MLKFEEPFVLDPLVDLLDYAVLGLEWLVDILDPPPIMLELLLLIAAALCVYGDSTWKRR